MKAEGSQPGCQEFVHHSVDRRHLLKHCWDALPADAPWQLGEDKESDIQEWRDQ